MVLKIAGLVGLSAVIAYYTLWLYWLSVVAKMEDLEND
jgi:hypothetical protein